jgi:hypothetical protein
MLVRSGPNCLVLTQGWGLGFSILDMINTRRGLYMAKSGVDLLKEYNFHHSMYMDLDTIF